MPVEGGGDRAPSGRHLCSQAVDQRGQRLAAGHVQGAVRVAEVVLHVHHQQRMAWHLRGMGETG